MNRITKEEWIERFKNVHGDKYDYSLVEYKNNHTKIKIICPIHGIFEQRPSDHFYGHGCFMCFGSTMKTVKDFIKEAKQVHGDKYDYSLVDYKGNHTKIKIVCPIHGIFEQRPSDHIHGQNCPYCSKKKKKTTKEFIKEANKVHEDKYDYSLVEYINTDTLVKIICSKHGIFEQTPHNHLKGVCCPKCNISKGENSIKKYFEKNNIKFEFQKKYSDLKDKDLLSYDFYLPDYNLLIEYNGRQHYYFDNFFYKFSYEFHKQLHHDWLKRKYARDNDIKLLTIPYWEFNNIDKILKENLSDC